MGMLVLVRICTHQTRNRPMPTHCILSFVYREQTGRVIIVTVIMRGVRQAGRAKAHALYSEFCVQRADRTSDHRDGHCHDESGSPNKEWAKAHALQSEFGVQRLRSTVSPRRTCTAVVSVCLATAASGGDFSWTVLTYGHAVYLQRTTHEHFNRQFLAG